MSEPKRVLLLGVGIDGGAGQYSAQLANGLAAQIETCVLLPDYDHTEFEELLDPAVTVYTFSTPIEGNVVSATLSRLGVLYSIIEQIRTIDPDVVHIPFYTSGFLRAYILPLLKGMQLSVVGTVHDPQSHSGQKSEVYGMDIEEKKRALGGLLMDRTLVHGPETKKQAVQAGYRKDSLRIVPHGIYTHFPESNTETNPTQLLFFGNIRENKGYDRIPEIVDKVAERQPEVSAVVVGDLSHSADKAWGERTLQQLRDHNRINLQQGYASMEETAEKFGQAAVVVLPYYDATTSGILMVAYRYNTPVVATNVGDLGHYVERDGTGLLANPDSVEEIADATVQILRNEECRQGLLANLRAVNERYSWESITGKIIDIYREVVG